MTVLARPHRRFNPLTGRWVLVSAERTKRPWQGGVEDAPVEARPPYDATCYLCPGNERAGGERNPNYESTYVFENDYPALQPDVELAEEAPHPLLRAESQPGTSRVLCFSPRHDLTLAMMSPHGLRSVVDLWAEQVANLSDTYRWVQLFENRGDAMGASNPHPHGQLWATARLPAEPATEDEHQRQWLAEHGAPLLVEYAQLEAEQGDRVVVGNDEWLVVVPFWAVWPFETLVLPRRPVQHLPGLDEAQRDALAHALHGLLVRYDNLFGVSFPYSMGWHGAPGGGVGEDTTHWQLHAHFFPPLLRSASVRKFMVGYEMLADVQRDVNTEQVAQRLREQPSVRLGAAPPEGLMTDATARDWVLALFTQQFGGSPTHLVRAPGRVNIIGEHTDYNDGFVLPAAIDREVWIALAPHDEALIHVVSEFEDEPARVPLDRWEHKAEGWARYVQGVAWALAQDGRTLAGWRGALSSDVPVGAGLSSSAALELGIARACGVTAGWDWDAVAIAKLCQRAENAWVGVNSGIMDQLASACGVDGGALLLDCRSLEVEPRPLPDGMTLVVMDTSTRRELSGSGYNDRRRECEQAAKALGVQALRDASEDMLTAADLDDVLLRRARHVVTENARTQAAAAAMHAGDAEALGKLMAASHRSMRDDFAISGEALDAIVSIASTLDGCYGARLTGGGFAGCAVALVATDAVEAFCSDLEQRYLAETALPAQTHVCRPVTGASVEDAA